VSEALSSEWAAEKSDVSLLRLESDGLRLANLGSVC
jgi:hypothetical protein